MAKAADKEITIIQDTTNDGNIMDIQMESVCIRCGKTRIFKRKWREVLERGAAITHTETVCPDKDCQKKVEADFEEKRQKRLLMESRKEANKEANKRVGIKL